MGKGLKFEKCPECGRKGLYRMDYTWKRCKYCGYAKRIEREGK